MFRKGRGRIGDRSGRRWRLCRRNSRTTFIGSWSLQTSSGKIDRWGLKIVEVVSGLGLVYCEWQDGVVNGTPGAMSCTWEFC